MFVSICTCFFLCFFPIQAISCHYASSHCDYIDVEDTTHEVIAKEVEELARKRLGPEATISFQVSTYLKIAVNNLHAVCKIIN